MKKNILLIVLIAAIAGVVFISNKNSTEISKVVPSPTQIQNEITVYQQIASLKEDEKFDTIQISQGKTALELLKETTTVETKGEGKNAFIIGINGRKADDTQREFWALYVNGKQAELGAGSYILKPKDEILWKIETY